jgi:hypothetical protein
MAKKDQPKNLYYLLVGILVAMVSVAEASANAVGEWKLKEVWKDNEAGLLPITGDGESYVLKLLPQDDNNLNQLRISIKVGNAMSSSVEILEEDETSHQQKIKIGFVMSTRMSPETEEKRQLENYLSNQLPKMFMMEVKGGEEQDKFLVLSSEAGAKIVCEPSEDRQD